MRRADAVGWARGSTPEGKWQNVWHHWEQDGEASVCGRVRWTAHHTLDWIPPGEACPVCLGWVLMNAPHGPGAAGMVDEAVG